MRSKCTWINKALKSLSLKYQSTSGTQLSILPKQKFTNTFVDVVDLKNQEQEGLIEQIFSGKIDGIIVRNIVSDEMKKRIRKNAKSWNYSVVRDFNFGQSLGQDLLSSTHDLEPYIEEVEDHIRGLNVSFGTDFLDFIGEVFGKVSFLPVRLASKEDGRTYKPVVIRVVKANSGFGFQEHIGNEFMSQLSQFEELKKSVFFDDQLSFFMVISEPEIGGELVLYDLVWDDTPQYLLNEEGLLTKLQQRTEFLSTFKKIHADLNEGDLIIFDGGRIWHSVNEATGAKDRITAGGFMGLSRSGKEIFFWA